MLSSLPHNMAAGGTAGSVRFDGFEFNLSAGELRKSGVRVRLPRQSATVLAELINRPGETVSRSELAAALWGEGTHVDFEDGINHAVKRLRDALEDDPRTPRYVERVPSFGYRFLADVTPVAASPQSPTPAWRRRRLLGFAAAFAAVLCLLAWRVAPRQPALLGVETVEAPAPVVAVAPFADLSARDGGGLFADGITDALTDELARISALRVISRTSVSRSGGADASTSDMVERLGVSHLVSGSVLRAGDEIRVTARLVDARADTQLWSTSYTADAGAPLAVMAKVPREIAAAIRVRLTPAEEARLASARPVRLDVFRTYSEAREAFESGHLDRSIELFEGAIRLDPDYAPAYSWLADAYVSIGFWAGSPDPLLKRAKTAALRAQRLDSTLAEPHLLEGRIRAHFEWRWEEADRHFRKALELNPNHVRAHLAYAQYLAIVNRIDEAVEMTERALRLDPLSGSTNALAGAVFHVARDYPRAIDLLLRAAALHPDGVTHHVQLGCLYGAAGEYSKAHEHLERAKETAGEDLRAAAIQAWVYARSGREEPAWAITRSLEEQLSPAHNSHYTRAFVYTALGSNDRAFAILDQAVSDRWPFLGTVMLLPPYDPIRHDPRFVKIIERMGLLELRARNAEGASRSASTQARLDVSPAPRAE